MARARPGSHAALRAIPGIGRRRVERYGRDLVAVVTDREAASGSGGEAPGAESAEPAGAA